MKLVRSKLKQIIEEEVERAIREGHDKAHDQSQWYAWAEEIHGEFGQEWWTSNDVWPTVDANGQLVIYIPESPDINATTAIANLAMDAGAESVEPGGQDTTVINTGVKFDGSVHRDLPPKEFERQQTQHNLDRDAVRKYSDPAMTGELYFEDQRMKLTKTKLKQIIKEEITKVMEEYDPVLGYDVAPEPGAEPVQVTDRERVMLKKRFKEYVSDHKETRAMVASGMIDKWADEAQPLNAQQFINAYLYAAPGATSQKLADLAQRGFEQEGLSFFNELGIPLKR